MFYQDQNDDLNIRKLAAQRYLYSFAKSVTNFQLFASVPLLIAVYILTVVLFPDNKMVYYLFAISLIMLDYWLFSPWISSLKKKAAKFQEMFDCDILRIPWNPQKSGSKPSPEDLIKYSGKYYLNDNTESLKNWYSINHKGIHPYISRIACQRSNLFWDKKLRDRYILMLSSLLIAEVVILICVWLLLDVEILNFIILLIALLPFSIQILKQRKENKESYKATSEVKVFANDLLDKSTSITKKEQGVMIVHETRRLQDDIFAIRCKNPLIPDMFYSKFRSSDEAVMESSINVLVEESRKKISAKSARIWDIEVSKELDQDWDQ